MDLRQSLGADTAEGRLIPLAETRLVGTAVIALEVSMRNAPPFRSRLEIFLVHSPLVLLASETCLCGGV